MPYNFASPMGEVKLRGLERYARLPGQPTGQGHGCGR